MTLKSEQAQQGITKKSLWRNLIGETICNVEEHWSQHNSAYSKSDPAKHLPDNEECYFLWKILLAEPKDGRTLKNFEAFFIAKLKPSLSRQEDANMLALFRNGVT